VKAVSDDPLAKASGGDAGTISKNSDDPNGLIAVAKALPAGKVSGVIEGTDGFYIVRLIDSKDNTIHFAKLFIAYTTFESQFAQLKKDGKIQEYIKVAQSVSPSNQ